MIARYDGRDYLYVANKRKKIITTHLQKTGAGFVYDGDLYFKEIAEEELSDIYDVEFWVSYKTNISHTPEWWKLSNERSAITKEGILLIFAEGILPEWDVVEKNVCSHRVDVSEIFDARMVLVYKKKDGKICNERLIEEKAIAVSELNKYFTKYSKSEL